MKRLQNRVSESRWALPVTSLFAIAVWLLAGLLAEQWLLQFVMFALTAYLMVELNSTNALIRIFSRMVSCAFLVLMCTANFLFPSLQGALTQLCFVATLLILFQCYQDNQAVGKVYYAFVCFGLGTVAYAQFIWLLPLLWLLLAFNLQALSWRTVGASLLGLLTPYWFVLCWMVWNRDFAPLTSHVSSLTTFGQPFDFSLLTAPKTAVLVFIVLLMFTGIVHNIRQRYQDSIRIRLLYNIFIWTGLVTLLLLALQPQHYDVLMRIAIVVTAPLIAHFLTLTSTRITNAAFVAITATALLLTAYSLWTTSSLF